MNNNITGKQKDVIEYILNKIKDSSLAPGDKIGTELALSKAIGITRSTVREATRYLVENNTIYRVKGSGLYVGYKVDKPSASFHALSPFDSQAKEKGLEGKRKVLLARVTSVPSVQIAHSLKIKPTEKVYYIERLMMFDSTPVALERICIPMSLIPYIEFQEFEKSKYSYIEKVTGKLIKTREQNIRAFKVEDKNSCDLLGVKAGQAMIELQEVVYFDDGMPFEFNTAIINSDLFNIHQTTSRE